MVDDTIRCPKCGHENRASSQECASCGISFELYFQKAGQVSDSTGGGKPRKEDDPTHPETGPKTCPNCGQPTDLSAPDCIKCGIVFTKFFEIQERALEANPIKLHELRQQKQAHQKAAALRQEREKRQRAKALHRKQMEQERIESLRAQRAELERRMEAERLQAEAEKERALKQQREAYVLQRENLRRQVEQDQAAALTSQRESLEKEQAEERRHAEQDKQEVLEKERAALEQQQMVYRQQVDGEKEAAMAALHTAYGKAEAEYRRRMEAELQEARDRQLEDLEKNRKNETLLTLMKQLPPQADIRDRLKPYEGQTVGLNHEDPTLLDPAVLVRVGRDHFSVFSPETPRLASYPFSALASVLEITAGMPVGKADARQTVYLGIKLFHPGG